MRKYRHIFFDLDRTLWDFDRNSEETLSEIFIDFGLDRDHGCRLEKFLKAYRKVNNGLWQAYGRNHVTKEGLRQHRFVETLRLVGVNDQLLAEKISSHYLSACPTKTNLLPYAIETLSYLNEHYQLHILTNGFGEAQRIKLEMTGIGHYFQHIIIAEEVGHRKPSRKIFEHAVELVGAHMKESLMIGDDLRVDIGGAAKAGMDQVYFNPSRKLHRYKTTYQVGCLSELPEIL